VLSQAINHAMPQSIKISI